MLRSKVKILNVVASVTMDQEIDLGRIYERFPHTEYDPKRFPGLIYRLKNPQTTMLIFNSGKMVLAGAKGERQVYKAVEKIIDKLKRRRFLENPKIEVQIKNVVASTKLLDGIDLDKAALKLDRVVYIPEEFSGLVYKTSGDSVTFLLFKNGKIICTGAKKEEEVFEAVKKLKEELREKNLLF